MLAHHTRLDYKEIRAVMPSNSVYVTIIREPVQVFESSYSYYGMGEFFGFDIHRFVQLLTNFDKKDLQMRFRGKFGINQMLFDLGSDPVIFFNRTLVQSYIDQLESWFDLVLVAERMDESLVLLRHLMCWDLDDVVTFKLNARKSKFKSNLNPEEMLKLRELNSGDVMLYDRFMTRFEAHVEAFGRERMALETAELRERTHMWYDMCVKDEEPPTLKPRTKRKYYFNEKVMVFAPRTVNNSTCKLLTMEELPFTDHLRIKQLSRIPRKSVSRSNFNRRRISVNKSNRILSRLRKI